MCVGWVVSYASSRKGRQLLRLMVHDLMVTSFNGVVYMRVMQLAAHFASLKNLTKLFESKERATSIANLTASVSMTDGEYWVTKLRERGEESALQSIVNKYNYCHKYCHNYYAPTLTSYLHRIRVKQLLR